MLEYRILHLNKYNNELTWLTIFCYKYFYSKNFFIHLSSNSAFHPVNPKFHPFIQTLIHPFNLNLPISLSIYTFHPLDNLTNRLFIHPSVHLSMNPFSHQSSHLSFRPPIYPFSSPISHPI